MSGNKIEEVTFYDTSSLFKAGFYLNGFAKNGQKTGYRLKVSRKIPQHLKAAINNDQWVYTLFSTSLFSISRKGKKTYICIDSHDLNSPEIIRGKYQGYHLPLLNSVDAYFKVNFNASVIENNDRLREYRHKIFPVNQFISLRPKNIWPFIFSLPSLMGGYDPNATYEKVYYRIRERIRHLKNWVTYQDLLDYRNTNKDIDVFYITSYRHVDRHGADMASRMEIIQLLRQMKNTKILTGLASSYPLPENYTKYAVPRMRQSDYLSQLSRARIVIYTRGVDNCLASKFALFQALGLCIVGHDLVNNTEIIGQYPHLSEQFNYSSPGLIVDRVKELMTKPSVVDEISEKNIEIFDKHFSPEKTAQQILDILQLDFWH